MMTHHERSREAAEAWHKDRICAMGWSHLGDLIKVSEKVLSKKKNRRFARARRRFLRIQKGDTIFAYAGSNMVAYVGEVRTRYRYTTTNLVGREDGFDYANQLGVKWWAEPHHFDRRQLPYWLATQLGKRDQIVEKLDLHGYGWKRVIKIIRTCAKSGSALDEFEDLAKAGLRKYMPGRVEKLERGLVIKDAEKSTSRSNRPDFLAIDARDRTVLIECKGSAHEVDCQQLERYARDHKESKPRLMLVAFKTDSDCRKTAREKQIELVECDLRFTRV